MARYPATIVVVPPEYVASMYSMIQRPDHWYPVGHALVELNRVAVVASAASSTVLLAESSRLKVTLEPSCITRLIGVKKDPPSDAMLTTTEYCHPLVELADPPVNWNV